MRQSIQEYGTELEQGGHGSISLRAGLNIGMLKLDLPAGIAIGNTSAIQIADTLAQSAAPNSILLTQQMHTYLADTFQLERGTSVDVANKFIYTFLLDSSQQPAEIQSRSALPDMPFVGRSDTIRLILGQLEQFNTGSVIVISGETGLGKSRILREVHHAAPMLQWLMGDCESSGIKPVYAAWNDLLLTLTGLTLTSTKRECEQRLSEWLNERSISSEFYPILAHQLGVVPLPERTPESIARQISEAWQSILTTLARQRPTVIVFDEVHAMDSSSLNLLEKLVETLQNVPIMWMLLMQPLYNQTAASALMRLGRLAEPNFNYLSLEPLNEDQMRSLLYSLLRVKSLADPLENGILDRVQGNPLFLQHIVELLIEKRGLVSDTKGNWSATAAALQDFMPTAVREVLSLRIKLLPEDAQQLLEAIGVAGNTLFPVLFKLLPTTLSGALALLQNAGLVDSTPNLIHPLVRESVYQLIPQQQRAAIHLQVAAAMTQFCELGGPWLAVRAYHMDKGLQTQGALAAYREAKEWGYAHNALGQVSEIIGAMLEFLDERDNPEQVASLLVEKQDTLYGLNPDDPRCKILLDRAYALWTELGKTSEAAGALLRMAAHHAGTRQEDHYYREAQNLLERENPRHDMLPSVYLRRALCLADQSWRNSARRAEELFEKARALALQLQDIETLAQIHFEMGTYLRDHHQLTEALAAFQQALSYYGQLPQAPQDERMLTCNYLADLLYHMGQPAKGEYYALEAVAAAPRTSDMIQVLPYVTLSESYAAQAIWPEALQAINGAPIQLAPPEMPLRFWEGRWTFEQGDMLEGLEIMRESVPTENVECMLLFIDYLLDGEFVEEASIRLHQLVKQLRLNEENDTAVLTQAFQDRLRGKLAAANKDFARAVSLMDKAMHQFSREGYVLLNISTRRAYANILLARCRPGDEEAARELLDQSLAMCKKLSIHAEYRRLQSAIRAHWTDGAPPISPPQYSDNDNLSF